MNNQICNPETQVNSGITLNEKDYINCLLSTLKEMTKNYAISMTEVSNEKLYQKYNDVFQKLSNMQRETYEIMFRNGWYKLEKAEQNKITQKLNMLRKDYDELNQQ